MWLYGRFGSALIRKLLFLLFTGALYALNTFMRARHMHQRSWLGNIFKFVNIKPCIIRNRMVYLREKKNSRFHVFSTLSWKLCKSLYCVFGYTAYIWLYLFVCFYDKVVLPKEEDFCTIKAMLYFNLLRFPYLNVNVYNKFFNILQTDSFARKTYI